MSISLQTWGEQLEDVTKAINSVLSSQRYEINGRMVQRADLQWLNRRYEYLVDKIEKYGADTIISKIKTQSSAKVSFE